MHCKYVIQGVTEDGRKFRPSDWIDRVSSMGATYHMQRLVDSDMLHPALFEGRKCLVFDTEFAINNPFMFDYVMNLAKSNQLRMIEVCDLGESKLGS